MSTIIESAQQEGSNTTTQPSNYQMLQELPSTAEVPLWFREYVDWHRQQLSLL
jgi:hypothetical protein